MSPRRGATSRRCPCGAWIFWELSLPGDWLGTRCRRLRPGRVGQEHDSSHEFVVGTAETICQGRFEHAGHGGPVPRRIGQKVMNPAKRPPFGRALGHHPHNPGAIVAGRFLGRRKVAKLTGQRPLDVAADLLGRGGRVGCRPWQRHDRTLGDEGTVVGQPHHEPLGPVLNHPPTAVEHKCVAAVGVPVPDGAGSTGAPRSTGNWVSKRGGRLGNRVVRDRGRVGQWGRAGDHECRLDVESGRQA